MSFIPFAILWILLALTVSVLFVWRQAVARNEDDKLHVLDGASLQKSTEQIALAHKLDFIDKWGKILTIVAVVYGLVLAVMYVWVSWMQTANVGV